MLYARAPEKNDEKSSGKFFFFIRIRKECRKSLRAIKTRYYVKYSTAPKFSLFLVLIKSFKLLYCSSIQHNKIMPNLCNFLIFILTFMNCLNFFSFTELKSSLSRILFIASRKIAIDFLTLTQFAVFFLCSEYHVLIMFFLFSSFQFAQFRLPLRFFRAFRKFHLNQPLVRGKLVWAANIFFSLCRKSVRFTT